MLGHSKRQGKLSKEAERVLKDLKRVFKVRDYSTNINVSPTHNQIHFYLVAIELLDITLYMDEYEGLPSGYYYAMYNECNETTYLFNTLNETLMTINRFSFDKNSDALKYCSDFDSFMRYVNNDCIE